MNFPPLAIFWANSFSYIPRFPCMCSNSLFLYCANWILDVAVIAVPFFMQQMPIHYYVLLVYRIKSRVFFFRKLRMHSEKFVPFSIMIVQSITKTILEDNSIIHKYFSKQIILSQFGLLTSARGSSYLLSEDRAFFWTIWSNHKSKYIFDAK